MEPLYHDLERENNWKTLFEQECNLFPSNTYSLSDSKL